MRGGRYNSAPPARGGFGKPSVPPSSYDDKGERPR